MLPDEANAYPLKLRMDNGPELVLLAQWAEEHGVMLEFIKPGNHRALADGMQQRAAS
nr:hypothetical protein [Serratia ficaria]